MATTSLFVEILVIGALTELWVAMLLASKVSDAEIADLISRMSCLKDFHPAIAFIALAMTYAIGWISNFVAERAFKLAFEKGLRNPKFRGSADRYEEARVAILQSGHDDVIEDWRTSRHIVRIARGNVLNFVLLAVALLANARRFNTGPLIILVTASLALAAISFAQWFTRYEHHYKRMATAAARVRNRSRRRRVPE